jgi:hypothetical protein
MMVAPSCYARNDGLKSCKFQVPGFKFRFEEYRRKSQKFALNLLCGMYAV